MKPYTILATFISILLLSNCGEPESSSTKPKSTENWSSTINTLPYNGVPNTKLLVFQLYDNRDTPLEKATVTAIVKNIHNDESILSFQMAEAAPGYYAIPLKLDDYDNKKVIITSVLNNITHQNEFFLNTKLNDTPEEYPNDEKLDTSVEQTEVTYTPIETWKSLYSVQPFEDHSLKTATTIYVTDSNDTPIENAEAYVSIKGISANNNYSETKELYDFLPGEYSAPLNFKAFGRYELTFTVNTEHGSYKRVEVVNIE